MRGYPPIHVFFLMLAFGAMAVPLAQLTFAKGKPIAAPPMQQAESKHTSSQLRIKLAHPATSISIKLGGHELITDKAKTALPIEWKTDLDIPADGIEFIITAEWPAGTPDTALTFEIEPDGLDTKSETRWSIGNHMTEVIAFQWK